MDLLRALPSKSWPLIKDYLAYRRYDLSKEEPSEGKIEAKNVDNEFVELTLEHGIKNNSSEVYLLDESNRAKLKSSLKIWQLFVHKSSRL